MEPFDEEVDVLVVGTGAAGCAAAVSAVLHGASKVLVLEKSKRLVGGTTRIAGGGWLWCPNNRFLKELGVSQAPAEIEALLRDLAYPGVAPGDVDAGDAELMAAFAEEWPKVIELIMQEKIMDLRVVDVREQEDADRVEALLRAKMAADADFSAKTGISEANIKALARLMPSYCAEHPLDLCPSGKVLQPDGGTTSRQLEKAVKRFAPKTEIRMGAQVVDVVFDAGGTRVVGALVLDVKTHETRRVRARRGVVFASGGYSHDKELLEKHFGAERLPFGSCAARTNTGDFAHIAESHGIPLSGMDLAWLKQVVLPFKFPERIGVFFLNGDSHMVVDRTGRRFACEKNFYQERGMEMLADPARRVVFFVYDERAGRLFEGPIKSLGAPYPSEGTGDDCVVRGATPQALAEGVRAKLREVAPDMALDADFAANLDAQLDRFNGYARSGKDLEFGRGDNVAQYCWSVPRAKDNAGPCKIMHPIEKKELCCVLLGLSTLDTKGGPRISRDAQVIGKDGVPVPGLYGAGNCVRSATQYSYPASGVTLSNAVLFGFLGGRHAMAPAQTKL